MPERHHVEEKEVEIEVVDNEKGGHYTIRINKTDYAKVIEIELIPERIDEVTTSESRTTM